MFKIYFIYEYYDGPVQGIAETRLGPRFFELVFSEDLDGFTNIAKIYPISGYGIDLPLLDNVPDYPLPEKLRECVNCLISDIENDKIPSLEVTAKFTKVKKGTDSNCFKVEWTE